jgi:hypothetical protein
MGGDGQCDGEWIMVMDGAVLRRWTARRKLDGEEWRDGDLTLTMMDDKESCFIKCSSLMKLNHYFLLFCFLIPAPSTPSIALSCIQWLSEP